MKKGSAPSNPSSERQRPPGKQPPPPFLAGAAAAGVSFGNDIVRAPETHYQITRGNRPVILRYV